MTLPASIKNLVETFSTHLQHYTSGGYNETQLRREFLDPFFEALGWDVSNRAGYADAYKDVAHEDSIRIGDTIKAPDYCFRIGGLRKFFVEAKKPSTNLREDIQPAYQLRRYAWSAKLPLSILSDFEEFAVYDTRIKPFPTDKSSTARIFYCTYDEYVSRWNEIESIFSREAILKGSFDKYAEENKRKRGTAEVDQAFLTEIEGWRADLARNIALRNPELSVRDINLVVQKTIDRIIFLRICEDRGTEDYKVLYDAVEDKSTYSALIDLFLRADARYNSGLFHFSKRGSQNTEPDGLSLKIKIDNKPLTKIIKNVYYPNCPYEFSVFPADILGQVYEQFLGKTISLTKGHRAKIEEKPEVRKAGGVYYTPTYIVEEIVRSTLGFILNGGSYDDPRPIPASQAAKIKVLDPACGSGSFLIVAYQYLLDWHLERYIQKADYHSRGSKPKLYRSHNDQYRLTTTERKRILLNNIHGVDIDPQAVEVTKLSLLLKVLENETEQIIQRDWVKERSQILPDLGRNIQCGNSLVGPDFFKEDQRLLLDEEEQYRINVFDWRQAFPDIMEKGGFDCVIGNPPYGATLDGEQKKYFSKEYTCQSYQLDSYLLFLERSLSLLLANKGKCGFIIPNPWLTNIRQTATRKFIFETATVSKIVHFGFPIFHGAVVDTQIVILEKPCSQSAEIDVFYSEGVGADNRLRLEKIASHSQKEWIALDGKVVNIFLDSKERQLLERLRKDSWRCDELFKINVGIKPYQTGKGTPKQTRDVVKARSFDADEKIDNTYREILRGRDINRYTIAPKQKRFISYGPWLAEPRESAGFDASRKILMRQTGDKPIAAIDNEKRLVMNNLHLLAPRIDSMPVSVEFCLAILNSRVGTWYYRGLNPEAGEALAEVKRTNVAALPIAKVDLNNKEDRERHDRLTKLVERISDLNERLAMAKSAESQRYLKDQIKMCDSQIEELVSKIFGLTKEESQLISTSRV